MDKMREDFERWAASQWPLRAEKLRDRKSGDGYPEHSHQIAWRAWQHLYPMVEAAYREGTRVDCYGFPSSKWGNSTAKARLEGKDD